MRGQEDTGMAETCDWTIDADPYGEKWDTSCGTAYCFEAGDPEDNHYKFCPNCGKPLRVVLPLSGEGQ